jgi:hypothetical protein
MAPVDATTPGTTDLSAVCTSYNQVAATGAATAAQLQAAVLGTVDDTAVTPQDGLASNPEGAEVATHA